MKTQFERAVARWNDLATSEDPSTYDELETVERVILSHLPVNGEEARNMARVLEFNLEAGGRSDSLDLAAIIALATST